MRHVWNQYVIRVPDGLRTPLREALTAARMGTEIYYPLGLHQQECFRYFGLSARRFARDAAGGGGSAGAADFPGTAGRGAEVRGRADCGVLCQHHVPKSAAATPFSRRNSLRGVRAQGVEKP